MFPRYPGRCGFTVWSSKSNATIEDSGWRRRGHRRSAAGRVGQADGHEPGATGAAVGTPALPTLSVRHGEEVTTLTIGSSVEPDLPDAITPRPGSLGNA